VVLIPIKLLVSYKDLAGCLIFVILVCPVLSLPATIYDACENSQLIEDTETIGSQDYTTSELGGILGTSLVYLG
jgi:hypothetical protein